MHRRYISYDANRETFVPMPPVRIFNVTEPEVMRRKEKDAKWGRCNLLSVCSLALLHGWLLRSGCAVPCSIIPGSTYKGS